MKTLFIGGIIFAGLVIAQGPSSIPAVSSGGGAPTGSAGGNLGCTYPNPCLSNPIGALGSYYVNSAPSSCSGGSTQVNCAWEAAKAYSVANNVYTKIILNSGQNNVCEELAEPAAGQFATVSIEGVGGGLGSHLLKVCSTPTRPVISKGENGGTLSILHMQDFSIEVAGNANSCADMWATIFAEYRNLDCRDAISGSDHDWQFGEHNNFGNGAAQEVRAYNILASGTNPQPGSPAQVTATGSGNGSYTVVNGGSGYSSTNLIGKLVGFGHGDHPCTTAPTLTITQSAGAIGSVSGSGGVGCTGTLSVQIYNAEPINYGFDISASDSTFVDLYPQVGLLAGVNILGGNNTLIHEHGVGIPVNILNVAANSTIVSTECDTIYEICIDFSGASGASVSGTNAFTAITPPGYSTYHFQSGASNVIFSSQGNLCASATPANYHMMVASDGPIGSGGTTPSGVELHGDAPVCGLGGNIIPKIFGSVELDGGFTTAGGTFSTLNGFLTSVAGIGFGNSSSVDNNGIFKMFRMATPSPCASVASPAVCGTANAGTVQVAAAATSLQVNTTAIATASQVGCLGYSTVGITAPTNIASMLLPYVSAIGNNSSFTLTFPVAPTVNPVNVNFCILN